jgi:hypothetical protein
MSTKGEPDAAGGGAQPGVNGINAFNCPPETAAQQKLRLLTYLRTKGSITTIHARERLRVMHAAGRVCDLRKEEFTILTTVETLRSRDGTTSRIARYTLVVECRMFQSVRDQRIQSPEEMGTAPHETRRRRACRRGRSRRERRSGRTRDRCRRRRRAAPAARSHRQARVQHVRDLPRVRDRRRRYFASIPIRCHSYPRIRRG